ncbi:MAG: L-threonylcarbamoyladenylate synthase [Rikenellaceae bacterium]
MGKLIKLYSDNTSAKLLAEVVGALEAGAIIIYPTDTLYAIGCSLSMVKSINNIKKMKGKSDDNLALICADIQQLSRYAKVDNRSFRVLKEHTPAPVTYVMEATGSVPNKFLESKKMVGVRITQNPIVQQIVEILGVPLVTTSLPIGGIDDEDIINPELLWEEYGDRVDIFVDGGYAYNAPSTVVELIGGELNIIRQGEYEF